MKCSIENCKKDVYCKKLCTKHYGRLKKHGDPNIVQNVWPEGRIEREILNSMDILGVDRMPTSTELKLINRNDLHVKISRTRKYSGWAEFLGLVRKDSETLRGQHRELKIETLLNSKGYEVEQMTTKFPYDLLINGTVKIDVKTGKAYILHGSRAHSFGINKKEPTCDIYIVLALDEQDQVERTFIIPSHLLKVVTLCIGKNSKYNRFIDRWDYIDKYCEFYEKVI